MKCEKCNGMGIVLDGPKTRVNWVACDCMIGKVMETKGYKSMRTKSEWEEEKEKWDKQNKKSFANVQQWVTPAVTLKPGGVTYNSLSESISMQLCKAKKKIKKLKKKIKKLEKKNGK